MEHIKVLGNIRTVPIVPYLQLPKSPADVAHLMGSRCKKCGETYLGKRVICLRCYTFSEMEEIRLSGKGEVLTFTIVYQSAPWVKTPYVAAVIKLSEGPVLKASLVEIETDPASVKVGMPVEMVLQKVRQDTEGNDVIAYKFSPLRQ